MEDDPSNISLLPSFHSVPFVQWVSCFLWTPLSAFAIISLAFPNWQASGSCQSVFLCVFAYHWRRNTAKGETPTKSPPRLRQSNISRIVLFLHGNGHFSLPLPIWKILSILYVKVEESVMMMIEDGQPLLFHLTWKQPGLCVACWPLASLLHLHRSWHKVEICFSVPSTRLWLTSSPDSDLHLLLHMWPCHFCFKI